MSEPVVEKKLTIQILSPLHIGDGGRLRRKQFARSGNQVVIAEEARLLARVQQSERLLDTFLQFCTNEQEGLEEFLRTNRIAPNDIGYTLPLMGAFGSQVFTFIKGADGRPYIPGSSLKGAVRSALLRAILLADPKELNKATAILAAGLAALRDETKRYPNNRERATKHWKEKIADDLNKEYFGQDQHHDWMRCFQFSDSAPLERNRLQAAEVKVLSVHETGLEFKQTPSERDMLLNPEVLNNTRAQANLTLNMHLLDSASAARILGFAKYETMIQEFPKACNRAAAKLIESEIQFYDKYRETGLVDWYRRLQNTLNTLAPNECLLELAWGSGFRPKTATSLLEEKLLDDVRWAFKLGKFGQTQDGKRTIVKPFPKSRKVVMRNREPSEPMGWIRLKVEG